ncbi:hypothetical protein D9611_011738 [Ephemerocybe angulata]|uniref:C2H2-type domain-containing protein n=1 Tax=Ephemerocybe angulata TaxID=980116 RepID=A0A8H5C689_9AGAR|nr:hypothetical protein D9611_011738 [Tulosesus angulatus]
MRVSIVSIVSLTLALANFVSAHSDDILHAREYVDDLSVRDIGDALADISTRDLISELSERLERRGGELLQCPHCFRRFVNPNNLAAHIAEEHSGNQRKVNARKPGRR